MTPSQKAKSEGLKSLSQVSKMTGVSLQTLGNWHRNKPELFLTVLVGCKERVTRLEALMALPKVTIIR